AVAAPIPRLAPVTKATRPIVITPLTRSPGPFAVATADRTQIGRDTYGTRLWFSSCEPSALHWPAGGDSHAIPTELPDTNRSQTQVSVRPPSSQHHCARSRPRYSRR